MYGCETVCPSPIRQGTVHVRVLSHRLRDEHVARHGAEGIEYRFVVDSAAFKLDANHLLPFLGELFGGNGIPVRSF